MMRTDVIVVGGGLAGLTAALTVAKAGLKVAVFEQSGKLGGRGATDPVNGFSFNLGPHALYRAGAAARIFAELNVQYTGGVPQYGGARMLHNGRLYDYPYNPATLASSRLLTLRSKIEVGRFLAKLPSLDTTSVAGLTVAEFLKQQFRTEPARRLVAASL